MQIVIKISDEEYEDVKNAGGCYYDFGKAILHGTPLPENHGKLVDLECVVDAIDDWINAKEYRYTNATDYLRNRIENVLTIIPADTESEGRK